MLDEPIRLARSSPECMAEVARLLSDGSAVTRVNAAQVMGDAIDALYGCPAAMEALAKAASDPDESVRATAIASLGRAGTKSTMMDDEVERAFLVGAKALEAALSDPEKEVRLEAISALRSAATGWHRINGSLPLLAGMLSDEDDDIFSEAMYCLCTMADKGFDITVAVPALVKAFKDGDMPDKAAEALGSAYDPTDVSPAIAAFREALSGPDEAARLYSVSALETMAKRRRSTSEIVDALSLALSDSLVEVRQKAANAFALFAERGWGDRRIDISAALPAISKALSDPDTRVRQFASKALAKAWRSHNTSSAASALQEARRDADPTVRRQASAAWWHATDVGSTASRMPTSEVGETERGGTIMVVPTTMMSGFSIHTSLSMNSLSPASPM